jgi:hypothetical protein
MLHIEDELTPRERAMFAALPRHRVGSAALEERVVGALVQHGLLRRMSIVFGRTPWRVMTQLAAAAAVFVVGVLVGQNVRATTKSPVLPSVESQDLAATQGAEVQPEELAPLIKRVGTAYVSVIAMLPADTVDTLARMAHNVAVSTFRAAASQMSKLHSDSVQAALHVADTGMTLAPYRR